MLSVASPDSHNMQLYFSYCKTHDPTAPRVPKLTVQRLVCNLTAPGGDRAASFRHGSPALLYTGNSRDKGIAPRPHIMARPQP